MSEVVVIGSLNMDLVSTISHFPSPGETVASKDFRAVPGGKGGNQAVAAAKLGCDVAMVGRVGRDEYGRILLESLKKHTISTDYIARDPEAQTGVALIAVDPDGENRIIIVPGANGLLGKDDVDRCQPLLSRARLLIAQFEVPLPTVERALERASHMMVILNPAPACPLERARRAIGLSHILVLNESEARILTGVAVKHVDDAFRAAEALLQLGPHAVVVTLGPKGAVLAATALREHIPAFCVEVVDTTAAGDAFVGGLAASLLHGSSILEAVGWATAAGALAVTRLGAQPSLPSAIELESFLQTHR